MIGNAVHVWIPCVVYVMRVCIKLPRNWFCDRVKSRLVCCNNSCDISLIIVKYNLTLTMLRIFLDDKWILVHIMAWCQQAPSHYLNQCWPWPPKIYLNTFYLKWCNSTIFTISSHHERHILVIIKASNFKITNLSHPYQIIFKRPWADSRQYYGTSAR